MLKFTKILQTVNKKTVKYQLDRTKTQNTQKKRKEKKIPVRHKIITKYNNESSDKYDTDTRQHEVPHKHLEPEIRSVQYSISGTHNMVVNIIRD